MSDRTNYCTGCKERQDRIEAQAAEIETMVPRDVAETWKAKAENLSAALKATAASNAEYLKTVVGLKEEIERLRDALKRIAGGWPKPMQLAREALEQKK